MKNFKRILALVMALVMAFALCACSDKANDEAVNETASDLDYIKANGKMVIGYTDYAPMNYFEGDEFVGFDTDFAKAVCEKLGVEPEFIEINWDTKEVELNAKSIDCIWNGFTITDERKENIEFSKPYIENKQVVVIKQDNKDKFTDTASLSAANLVAEVSSAGESAIADDENLSKANYVAVQKQTDGLLEVKAGTADAVVLDYTLADAMVGEGTDYEELMIIDGLDLCVENYGIGFRKGSDVAKAVDTVIDELLADGTLEAIAEKYTLGAILVK